MVEAPPYWIMRTVERFSPGFWQLFFYHANVALDRQLATLTSWYRDPTVNAATGGAADSQHLIGTAFDVHVPIEPDESARRLRGHGFVVVEYPTHLHAQAFPAGLARASGLLAACGL